MGSKTRKSTRAPASGAQSRDTPTHQDELVRTLRQVRDLVASALEHADAITRDRSAEAKEAALRG